CFLWVEKYKRLSADEGSSDREQTPACDASWAPIDATSCWERSPTRCCSIWAATACARAACYRRETVLGGSTLFFSRHQPVTGSHWAKKKSKPLHVSHRGGFPHLL